MWQTWKARNERIFKGILPWPPSTIQKAQIAQNQWSTCPRKMKDPPPQPQHNPPLDTSYPPPSTHDFEIHCDGSFFSESQEAAFGIVVTNCHGQVCDGKAETMQCFSPLEAEAKALWEGTRLAASLSTSCRIVSDCLTLIKALAGSKEIWPWRAAVWINHIKRLASIHPGLRFDYTNRKSNSKANWVARSCAKKQLPTEWIQVLDVIAPLL
ncbi:unnamed protein product [Linum trigynum]|uniref:RNase H type-1 domain-containing protein n=1 Tax=Linum trigynum TaxID=586398 RepID=A0AAV2F4Y7_9ROSI